MDSFSEIRGSYSMVKHSLIPFYLQAVHIHSANGVKLLEARKGVLSSTPPYK
jgi:hypothetical protein